MNNDPDFAVPIGALNRAIELLLPPSVPFPADLRPKAEAWIARMMVRPTAFAAYLRYLQGFFAGTTKPKFDAIDPEILATIAQQGIGAASDRVLALLLVSSKNLEALRKRFQG